MVDILIGDVVEERNPYSGAVMLRRADVRKPQRMYEWGSFAASETERVPATYYLPPTLDAAIERLEAHGVTISRLEAPRTLEVEQFRIDRSEVASRPFQNHQERTVEGAWEPASADLPAGTVVVDMTQPLARLALILLEPRSDDGLLDWNVLDAALKDATPYPAEEPELRGRGLRLRASGSALGARGRRRKAGVGHPQIDVGIPRDRASPMDQVESLGANQPLHRSGGMHDGAKRVAPHAPHGVLERHDRPDVPAILRIREGEAARRPLRRREQQRLVRRIAADHAIERHNGRRVEVGCATDEIAVTPLHRI